MGPSKERVFPRIQLGVLLDRFAAIFLDDASMTSSDSELPMKVENTVAQESAKHIVGIVGHAHREACEGHFREL